MQQNTKSVGNGLDKYVQKLAEFGRKSVVAGFFDTHTYPDGEYVAQVAALNEYGTSKIPARPFFRAAIEAGKTAWPQVLSKAIVATGANVEQSYKMVGIAMEDGIKASIAGWTTPSNAPSTVKKKGFNKPLVDTGEMLRAPEFRIE